MLQLQCTLESSEDFQHFLCLYETGIVLGFFLVVWTVSSRSCFVLIFLMYTLKKLFVQTS